MIVVLSRWLGSLPKRVFLRVDSKLELQDNLISNVKLLKAVFPRVQASQFGLAAIQEDDPLDVSAAPLPRLGQLRAGERGADGGASDSLPSWPRGSSTSAVSGDDVPSREGTSDTGVGSVAARGELIAAVSESTRSQEAASLRLVTGSEGAGSASVASFATYTGSLPTAATGANDDLRHTPATSIPESPRRSVSETDSVATQSNGSTFEAVAEEEEHLDNQTPPTTAEDSAIQSSATRLPRILVERPFEGVVEDTSDQ
mmetsp:Transcript_49953/g.113340  ORF Transcript_49953/g.113340 Transcript_49953/m.113340 type:complete len:258 (+) Transcript_49953:173-946(+)